MSKTDHIFRAFENRFHPVSHYDSPDDVLRDAALSAAEKRVILSSWTSDMYAVESNPSLRAIPGMARMVKLDDVLAALRELDGPFDPPPRGGAAIRAWRPTSLDAMAHDSARRRWRRAKRRSWVAARS